MGRRRGSLATARGALRGVLRGLFAPLGPLLTGTFPPGGIALVVGATGGIGRALLARFEREAAFASVIGFARTSSPHLELTSEASIAACAETAAAHGGAVRLIIDATGVLRGDGADTEKRLAAVTPEGMARAFAVNAIGPALLMKHFLPLLPRDGKAVFATLSARVGSIGDNRLGGWLSYRASKAALNQIVRTASIELKRRCPHAICVALHPGTVETALSHGFTRDGLQVHTPDQAAAHLLDVIDRLRPDDSGSFLDWQGDRVPW